MAGAGMFMNLFGMMASQTTTSSGAQHNQFNMMIAQMGNTQSSRNIRRSARATTVMFRTMKNAAGAAQKGMITFQLIMKLMKTMMKFIDVGMLEVLLPYITELFELLSDPDVQEALKEVGGLIGDFLGFFLDAIITGIKALKPYLPALTNWLHDMRKLLRAGAPYLSEWLKIIGALVEATEEGNAAMSGFMVPFQKVGENSKVLNKNFSALSINFGKLNSGGAGLNKTFGSLGTNTLTLNNSFSGLNNNTIKIDRSLGRFNMKLGDFKKLLDSIKLPTGDGGGDGDGDGGDWYDPWGIMGQHGLYIDKPLTTVVGKKKVTIGEAGGEHIVPDLKLARYFGEQRGELISIKLILATMLKNQRTRSNWD